MTQAQPRLRERLCGLGATLVILLVVVGTPLLLVVISAVPWDGDISRLRQLLTSPDDGTLALGVVAMVAWAAWAVVAVSVIVEAAARMRGLPTPSLPGLGLPQRAAGQLMAVAALLFVATPTVIAAFPTPPAHAAAAPFDDVSTLAAFEAPNVLPEAAPVHVEAAPVLTTAVQTQSTIDYTVKRGDSLWKIADRLLGDGARYTEIVDLNRDVLNGQPDFIFSGTVLKVPHVASEADDRHPEEYVVRPGDTLSEIAEEELGDAMRYRELFEASRDTVQPDGTALTDPDLIRPGWEITIPDQAKHKAEVPNKPPVEVVPPMGVEPPTETPTVVPTPAPSARAESGSEPVPATPHDAADDVESASPGWLLPGLTGAGAVLAALILLAVRAHRNTQLRYRRPGQTIAPPPPELRAVEKSAFVSGGPLTGTIEDLDGALLHLAGFCTDEGRSLPPVVTATLAKGAVTLHLAEDDALPEPWTGAGREWSLLLVEPLPDREDALPPYPLLVTVGQDDAGLQLVNLEHLGTISLKGPADRTMALARHIAAELALNPWSVLVEVSVIGVGEELAPLDSLRLHHHLGGDQVVPSIARELAASLKAGWGDPDPYRAVITTGDGTSELAPLLSTPTSRLGAALVSLAPHVPGATVIDVDATGRLRAPALDLDLRAAGLTNAEAAACAAIVDLTRESQPVPVAPFEQAADGWRALADQAGALREELTNVREPGPAGAGSLLPSSAEAYVQVAATTVDDVETLAPVVSKQVRRTVEEADPTLDTDVEEWFDPGSKRPRLTLLGPANAHAFGVIAPVIMKRRPYFVEILAYLALHPNGVTGSAVAEAFGIAASRARTDLSSLRDWLGTNPRTGGLYLPAANESPTYRETRVKTYQVEDVLVDVDLFRRLRARGEARGTEGIEVLKTAMSLVEGQPFSMLRERGWSWLLDTERVHETIGCAIVDTAHVLVLDALANGDLSCARETAELACKAMPYDDICRLDLVKVAAAEGHPEAADKMLADDVFNRSDDYLPPVEIPVRTKTVVKNNGWGCRPRTENG